MKKKNRLLVFLVLVLSVVVAMTALFACVDPNLDKDEKDDTKIETRDQLLSNGTFYNSTSSTSKARYVKDTVAGWQKTSGAIGYSTATMGSIDVKTLKDNAGLIWDTARFRDAVKDISVAPNSPKELKADGTTRDFEDTYAAVIASTDKEASVYFSSSSATLEKGKYYKLTIDVWTLIDNVAGETGEGAYLFVTDGVYSEWQAIDTKGKWETFSLYVEANNFENRSFSVQLWLGHGPAKIGTENNPRLTRGVALFDNVILKEVTDADYAAIDQDAENAGKPYQYVKKESIVFPDQEFEYNRAISSSSTASSTTKAYYSARVGAPYNYTQIVGKTDLNTDKPYVSSAGNSAPYGIFDLSKLYTRTDKDGKVTWQDTFQQLNTTEFTAPDYADFYDKDGKFDNHARKAADSAYQLKSPNALLIFNSTASGIGYKSDKKMLIETGKFYKISVSVYVYKTLNLPNRIVDTEGKAVELTKTQVEENQKVVEEYNTNLLKAHMKLTGASLKDAEELTAYTKTFANPNSVTATATELKDAESKPNGKFNMTVALNGGDPALDASTAKYGEWQTLEFYVQGNSLSNRLVNVEFWLGEGTKNDVSTLYKGGAIFDSLNIKSGKTAAEVDPAGKFGELSPFNFSAGNDYADLMNVNDANGVKVLEKNKKADPTNRTEPYSVKFADGVNSADSVMNGLIVGADYIEGLPAGEVAGQPTLAGLKKEDFGKWTVKDATTDKKFNTLMLRNTDFTASQMTVNATAPIYANNYYRLSMWVKTIGIEKGKGVTINLLLRNTEADYKTDNIPASFTAVNTKGEWAEYVFYINGNYVDTKDASGAKLDYNAVTVQFIMGTGDSYNSATHIKGDLMVGALNIQGAITNTEYSSAATNETMKKYAFSATISTEDTVSGGRFNSVDYDATIKAYTEKNEGKKDSEKLDAYDKKGNLTGIGKTSTTTWSQTNPVSNQVSTPTALNISDKELSWDGNADAASYEIFFKDILVGRVTAKTQEEGKDPDYKEKWVRTFTTTGTFYVRAVPKEPSKKLNSNKNSISTSTAATGDKLTSFDDWQKTAEAIALKGSEFKDYETNFGIIDYKKFDEKNLDALKKNDGSGLTDINDIRNLYTPNTQKYGVADANESRYFFGADGILSDLYNNVLMLSSQYNTRGGYTMYSSTSLSSEAYYEISVWVKTMGDATASFTIDNSTSTFYNTEKTAYIGFNNIKTDGEWVQLKLYAKTGLASAALKLKLFMGDPYEKDYTAGKGLCKGTVFFDDIAMTKLASKDAYDKLVKDKEGYSGDGTFFNANVIQTGFHIYSDLTYQRNVYAYKFLEFSIDSFDVSTESTTTATGKKPDDYSQSILGENTSVSDAAQAKVAYGVYNVPEMNEEKFAYLYHNFFENEKAPAWWGIQDIEALKTFMQGFGDNTLVMANFSNNGINYKSSTKSIKAGGEGAKGVYYQISFYAKLKTAENKKAEFRFYHGDDTTKYESIVIDGYNSAAGATDFGFKKYTMYVLNESTSSVSSNYITFNLGTKTDDKTDFVTGMLVVDNVAISEITEAEYTTAKTSANYDKWGKEEIAKSTSGVNFAKFSTKTTDETPPEEPEKKGWSAENWLILSTSLISAMIVIAVAAVLIRKFKKKHIKTKAPEVENNVKVEGFVKTQKEAKKDADRREFDD